MKRTLLFLLLAACTQKAPPPESKDAGRQAGIHVDPSLLGGRIVIEPLARRALRGDRIFSAELVPSESGQAEVGSLAAGRVASIEVKDGEHVSKGQVLAWVDSPEAARIVADAIRARAKLAAANKMLARQLALEADRATSAIAVDAARTEVDTARAESSAARVLLAGLGLGESDAVSSRVPVKAPIDGVVAERTAVLGAAVTTDKLLFRLVATERVVVDVRWSDPTAAVPAAGSKAKILARELDAGSCDATVTASVSLVDERTRSRRIRLIPNGCTGLVTGAFVEAAFDSGTWVGLAVPKNAVVDVRGAPTVFVALAEPGRFEPRLVQVGSASAEDVAIASGLAEGDRVVVTGAVLLKGELLRSELEP